MGVEGYAGGEGGSRGAPDVVGLNHLQGAGYAAANSFAGVVEGKGVDDSAGDPVLGVTAFGGVAHGGWMRGGEDEEKERE